MGLASAVAGAYERGVSVRWEHAVPERYAHVDLPEYPFSRTALPPPGSIDSREEGCATGRQGDGGSAKAPAAPVKESVVSAIRELLPHGRAVPSDDDPIDATGLDSLGIVSLRDELEQRTDKDVPLGVLLRRPTVAELVSYLRASSAASKVDGQTAAPRSRARKAGRAPSDGDAGPLVRTADFIAQGCRDGSFPGAQLYVSRYGVPQANLADGFARPGRAMRIDTPAPWFCSAKPLLAATCMSLWEQELLSLDDSVSRFVDEFGSHDKREVTIRHLLTHTAGVQGDPTIAFLDSGRERMLQAAFNVGITDGCRPGRQAYYSVNWGWLVLSEVVERLTNESFLTSVEERVLRPAGADEVLLVAGPQEADRAWNTLARLFRDLPTGELGPSALLESPAALMRQAPGVMGTGAMRQLGRIFEALLDGRCLRPTTLDAMTKRDRVALFDAHHGGYVGWGLGVAVDGWIFGRRCSPRTFGHSGHQSSFVLADPDYGLVIAAFMNRMPGGRASWDRARALVDTIYVDLGIADEAPQVLDVAPDRVRDLGSILESELALLEPERNRGANRAPTGNAARGSTTLGRAGGLAPDETRGLARPSELCSSDDKSSRYSGSWSRGRR